jgi:hypothetical protein
MPYDDMDKFVAFSKCLASFSPGQFSGLTDRIAVQMDKLLDRMNPATATEAATLWTDFDECGNKPTKATSPPVSMRDDLDKLCRKVLGRFARGNSYETYTNDDLASLQCLAKLAIDFSTAVLQYQKRKGTR